jgi:UDP-glucose 4-epimerase
MKALVTGAAGFIGSHLAEGLLELGWEVVGVDALTDYYSRRQKEDNLKALAQYKNFSFRETDILKLDLKKTLRKIDYLFHAAAQPGVRKSWGRNLVLYIRNNINATQKLLEAARGCSLRKFILTSSSSVYGESQLPMGENNLPLPLSPYGLTKLAAENFTQLYYKTYQVPVVVLRYFTVYGPRQRPDMAFYKFVRAGLDGEEVVIYGDGNQTRDFTYVSDIIAATIRAAQSEVTGEVINIGGGEQVTVNQTLKILEEILQEKIRVSYIAPQKGDMLHTYADITKAKRLLAYRPQVKLPEGLRKEVEWLANQTD